MPYSGSSTTTSWPSRRRVCAVRPTAVRISGCNAVGVAVNGMRSDSAIRSRPGSRPTASRTVTGGGLCRSPLWLPATTSNSRAASATVRASGPLTVMPWNDSGSGHVEMRPRCGLMPTRWVHAAGMRTEPAPSDPMAAGTMPAATAAALPPDDPPGVWSRPHGLRV